MIYTAGMARPLRIEFAGALYHITSRGDRREAIYEDDGDREAFLGVLAEVVERYNWICHAYCLMTNHYHLVIETVEGNLSRGMRQLNGVYTQASNRTHRVTLPNSGFSSEVPITELCVLKFGQTDDRVDRWSVLRRVTRCQVY